MKNRIIKKLFTGLFFAALCIGANLFAHVCTNEYCENGICTYCGGDGQYGGACTNSACTNGLVVCDICGGTGFNYCSECGGAGYLPGIDPEIPDLQCPECNGTGTQACSCVDGFVECPVCGGDDLLDCPICNGTGLCQVYAGIQTTGPDWWFSHGVILTNIPPIDYGAVNQGQLKHIATQAWLEMSNTFAYATVSNIHAMVQTFSASTNDFAPANIGQLKYVAKPFYDVLISEAIVANYPWTASSSDDDDYNFINAGQLKAVFSFEISSP